MKKHFIISMLLLISTLLFSCNNSVDNYPISEKENIVYEDVRIHVWSDELCMNCVYFSTYNIQEFSETIFFEKYDGENWRTLYSTLEQDAAESQDWFKYEEIDSSVLSFELDGVYKQFGEGLYRVLKLAITKDTKEICYVAKEIVILDEQLIEKQKPLKNLLFNTEIESIELLKGNEVVSVDQDVLQELWSSALEMQFVGHQNVQVAMGGNEQFYLLKVQLADGRYLTIRNAQGKNLEGHEYSAICKISGMGDAVLLYGKQEWVDVLTEKIQ